MQAIRLERRAHAALDVGRRTCVTRIQLVHTIAGVLCHHMRQRRLPQARRAGQEQHTLVRTPKLVGRALVHAARTRRIASKHTRVPCFDPTQHVAVQPIVAQQVGERARPILVHPHARVSRPHTPRLTHHIGRPRTHARHEHVQRLAERRRIRRRRRRTPCPDAPAPGYQDTRAVQARRGEWHRGNVLGRRRPPHRLLPKERLAHGQATGPRHARVKSLCHTGGTAGARLGACGRRGRRVEVSCHD